MVLLLCLNLIMVLRAECYTLLFSYKKMNCAGLNERTGQGGMNVNKTVHSKMLPLNLQLFAADEGSGAQGEENTNVQTQEGNEQQEGEKPKTLDELLSSDKALQSDFDKKINKALETAKAKWEQQAKDDANEAKKLEKMSADERARYQLDKDKAEFAREKEKFAHEQLKTAVASELVSRGYTADFAEFLTGKDAESSNANINAFESAFKKAVEAAAADKLRGDHIPPAEREHGGQQIPPKDYREYEEWRKKNA